MTAKELSQKELLKLDGKNGAVALICIVVTTLISFGVIKSPEQNQADQDKRETELKAQIQFQVGVERQFDELIASQERTSESVRQLNLKIETMTQARWSWYDQKLFVDLNNARHPELKLMMPQERIIKN